jgi:5,10-methylene-tetrahydrofolate dehydrogenase/methenyl tetrahydrofolate cyclohydrolase
LAAILIGDNSASHIYVKNKAQACHEVGDGSDRVRVDVVHEDDVARLDLLQRAVHDGFRPCGTRGQQQLWR